jgi:hypothetical protein
VLHAPVVDQLFANLLLAIPVEEQVGQQQQRHWCIENGCQTARGHLSFSRVKLRKAPSWLKENGCPRTYSFRNDKINIGRHTATPLEHRKWLPNSTWSSYLSSVK